MIISLLSLSAPPTMSSDTGAVARSTMHVAAGSVSVTDGQGEEGPAVSKFSPEELEYLTTASTLGRIATLEPGGRLHVVPVGWRYNPDHDAIDVSGREFSTTKKFRNVQTDSRVAFLVDEVLPPWRPRAVMVQGRGEAVEADGDAEALIRITPERVVSWGV